MCFSRVLVTPPSPNTLRETASGSTDARKHGVKYCVNVLDSPDGCERTIIQNYIFQFPLIGPWQLTMFEVG